MSDKRRYDIREKKQELRRKYRAQRKAISKEEKKTRDDAICARFLSTVTYRLANILLVYAPLDDEIDIMLIVRRALADRKTVAFPRCDTETPQMTFHIIRDEGELCVGAYGIREPRQDAPVYCRNACDGAAVCLLPGLLFDEKGFRLGYGKGYYDRYLTAFVGTRVGFVYSDFLLERVPRGRYDLSAHVIVTEKEVRVIGESE